MRFSFRAVLCAVLLLLAVCRALPAQAAPVPIEQLAAVHSIGDSVVISDQDSNPIGQITVTDLQTDFTETTTEPDSGMYLVVADVTIENTGADPLPIVPVDLTLTDSLGACYGSVTIDRTDSDLPNLDKGEIEAGETLDAFVAWEIPKGRDVAQFTWFLGPGQLVTPLQLAPPIESGAPVAIYASSGDEVATVAVDGIEVGWDAVAPGISITDGFTIVGADFTIENTGHDDYDLLADGFILQTTTGTFTGRDPSVERSTKDIVRVPDLIDTTLAPGESVEGFIPFTLFDYETPRAVIYAPDAPTMVEVWDNPDLQAGADFGSDPSPDSDHTGGDLGPVFGSNSDADDGDQSSEDDCAGAVDYQTDTLAILGDWSDIVSEIDFANLMDVPASVLLSASDDLSGIAERQENLDIPPAATEFNQLLVDAYTDDAGALEQMAKAVALGNQTALQSAVDDFGEVGDRFGDGGILIVAIEALQEICPEIDQL